MSEELLALLSTPLPILLAALVVLMALVALVAISIAIIGYQRRTAQRPYRELCATLSKQGAQIDALEETIEDLQAAAQALPDGVVTLDDGLRITACNRAASAHLGAAPEACQGQDILHLLPAPEFRAYVLARDWREPVLVRTPARTQARTQPERLLMLRLVAYGNKRRLLMSRDVTQLDKLETTRRDFVANVSHELRTPLTVLAGFLETLRDLPDEAVSTAQRAHYLGLMHEQAGRMQAIVADLLTLSTLESSPGPTPAPVGMAALLETVRIQAERLSEGHHQFDWEIDESLDVLGTASELASAFANLLGNAVHYTPAGGRISVCWRRQADGSACYRVTDTGLGIAAEHLPRLTERFYRVDRSRSRAAGGTGLGLAITKHIALRHEAELEIASTPGAGSTFSLRFPAARVLGALQTAAQAHDGSGDGPGIAARATKTGGK